MTASISTRTREAIRAAVLLLAIVLGLSQGPVRTAIADDSRSGEPSWIYIGVTTNDAPFVDYEGDGVVRAMGVRRPKPGDPFSLTLTAVRTSVALGGEPTPIIQLRGRATRSGKSGFRFAGELDCDRDVVVQFVQMLREGEPSGDTFPELAFGPGRHAVRFEGRLVGWLDPED